MPLYTFIFEYGDGTYLDQLSASDHIEAVKFWAMKFYWHNKHGFKKYFERNFHEKLLKSIDFDLPVQIQGISNTWSASTIFLDKIATIYCVTVFEG